LLRVTVDSFQKKSIEKSIPPVLRDPSNVNTFTITSLGNVSCTGSIGCVGVSASSGITGMRIGFNLGNQNSSPLSMLLVHLGYCTVTNSAPVIVFGKNTGGGARNAFMGYNDTFYFTFLVIMEIQMHHIL
jgi:hypothetical protein